jgi:muconolactone delta-isomerase
MNAGSWQDKQEHVLASFVLRRGRNRRPDMQFLVEMKIVPEGRPMSAEEGAVFFEEVIHPTLELCKKLQEEKKILAGGPISGTIGLVLVVKADSARELDDLVTGLPVWPRMETEVTPLTTFEDRALSIQRRLSDSRDKRSAT